MRVLVRTQQRAFRGGIETYVSGLLAWLREASIDVALAYEVEAEEGSTPIDRRFPEMRRWNVTGRSIGALMDEIVAWKPDVVFDHGSETVALNAALAERFPFVAFVHVYAGTCITGQKMHAFPVPRPCERRFGPACLALFLPRRCGGLNPVTALRLYEKESERLAMLRRYDALLVGSESMREDFVRQGFRREDVSVHPYYPDGGALAELPPAPERTGAILMLSRFTKLKGGRHLVRALPIARARLGRPLSLILAGAGPELEPMKALAARLGVDVELEPRIPLPIERRQALMRRAEVLAFPSVWPEPYGLVGLEAGAVGLPTVAYASGGPLDWCVPGVTGELAPADPPTPEGLAGAIVRALRDPEHHERLRRGAFEQAHRLTLGAHMEKVLAVLRDAAARLR